uniref:Endonuclease/exonuclease/phosphatase domain-containing protein n=1 Tax=Megaselia scalaris TaxID=36166 RepID=T1H5B8_MEGSC
MDTDMRICTWNIQSIYTRGAVQDLRRDLSEYKADISVLREIRWTGKGKLEDKSKFQCDIYFSCYLSKHELGVGQYSLHDDPNDNGMILNTTTVARDMVIIHKHT